MVTVGESDPLQRVLVFSKTAGFRHDSIPQGIAAIQALGAANDFAVDATEDAAQFTDANLARYDVVVFLSTTGDVLNADQQAAFERYIESGGGFAGIHAAADTEYTWPWYGQMLGAYFRNHPAGTPDATVRIEDGNEPSTTGLPDPWPRTDEWYNFQSPVSPVINGGGDDYSPRASGVHVLATVDESTYAEDDGNSTDDDHPVVWCSNYDGGRAWYTAMGHTQASFSDANFRKQLLGGIQTAAGVGNADCGPMRQAPPSASDFEITALDDDTESPMELAVAKDGRVFYVERITGEVNVIKPDGSVLTAGTIPVSSVQENGLLGIALDPDFETNHNLYVAYTPLPNDSTETRIARFTVNGDQLDMASQRVIFTMNNQRTECCHSSGSLAFDASGNLYLSTGDNTNPFNSDGFTPIDERRRPRVLGRAAHRGQHEQLQRQGAAHSPAAEPDRDRRRRRLHDPRREPVRAGHREHAARDLRDGLPQPVPDHHRPVHPERAAGQLRPGRGHHGPEPRPAGQRRVRHRHAGQLRLAVLHPRQRPVQRLRLRDEHVGPEVQLHEPHEHVAQQHRPDQPPAGQAGDDVDGLLGDRPAPSGARHRRRSHGRAALQVRPRAGLRHQVPAVLRRQVVHRGVEQRLDQDRDDERRGHRRHGRQ